MFRRKRQATAPAITPQRPSPHNDLTPERVAAYLEAAHAAKTTDELARLTLELLEEYGATSHALLSSETSAGKLIVTPKFVSPSWASGFGDLRPHLRPSSLKVLAKKTLPGRDEGTHLTQALVANRDIRLLDAYGLATLLGSAHRNPPTGTVISVPIAENNYEALHLLAHVPRRRGLLQLGLAPLIRTVVLNRSDLAAGSGSNVSRQWLLASTTQILASSNTIRHRRPDLNLEPGTPIERTFPTARVELENLEAHLLLDPKPDSVILDLDAVARSRNSVYQVNLALEFTPVRLNLHQYVFLAKPSSIEGESLQELGDSAILHSTMQQVGMFFILDRFGTIHSATESLTDNLGYDPLAVKDLNITAMLDEESITKFNTLRENTLLLLNQPGSHSRVHNSERVPVTLQARDGTSREFDLSLILLRSRVDGEALPRGFVAVINITNSQALLHKELTERLRFVRHDRHSSANAIAALVDEIRRAPNLTRGELDRRLTDIHDEARVWSEITDTHGQLLETLTSPGPSTSNPQDQLLSLGDNVADQVPRYTRFYARHKLRRADRERVKITVNEGLKGVTAWASGAGYLTLFYSLRNLIENAVKYTTPNASGEREIHTNIYLDPDHPDHVRVEVTNAATGLSPADLQEVWEYRRRLANSGNDVTGTGIGLWSTRQLTERAGGRVGAYLHPDGQRVSFYISFPLVAFQNLQGGRTVVRQISNDRRLQPVHPEDVRALVRFATVPRGTPPKVLVLDGDPDDLNLTAHYFKHISTEITAVQTPAEALAAIGSSTYDLVLAEYHPNQRDELATLFSLAKRSGATARVLTSAPSAVDAETLAASSTPKALFKDALTPITAVNLAYGRRESHEPPRTA